MHIALTFVSDGAVPSALGKILLQADYAVREKRAEGNMNYWELCKNRSGPCEPTILAGDSTAVNVLADLASSRLTELRFNGFVENVRGVLHVKDCNLSLRQLQHDVFHTGYTDAFLLERYHGLSQAVLDFVRERGRR